MRRFDPEVLEKLQLITVSDPDVDADLFPDFFIAGPQRTGSTWLYINLLRHPEVFMPEVEKEIYFFNLLKTPRFFQHRSTDLAWYMRYFDESSPDFAKRRERCMARFGIDYEPKVRGEATASYAAAMDDDAIREVLLLNPDLKVIITIRNPVRRAWSHAKKNWMNRQKRPVSEMPESAFEELVSTDPYVLNCGMYTRHIARWSEHCREGNVLVLLFDDLRNDPGDVLRRTARFLGISSDPRYTEPDQSKRALNATDKAKQIPPHFEEWLQNHYAEEIARLREAYGVPW